MPRTAYSFDECLVLGGHGDSARTLRAPDELHAVAGLVLRGGSYMLASKAWVAPLSGAADNLLHVRLAEVFELRGDGLRAARVANARTPADARSRLGRSWFLAAQR